MDEFSDGKSIFLKPDAIQYDKEGNEMAHWRFDVPAPKREWVGLTDEDALRLWAGDVPRPVMGKNKVLAFARAIEAKLKEKNG